MRKLINLNLMVVMIIMTVVNLNIFAQSNSSNKLRALSIEFSNFAKEEYSKLKEVNKKSQNDAIGETIERLEGETEAEVEASWLRQKGLEIIDNVNVANFIRNQYRWYLVNSKNDPELAIDLVSQHILTHSLEVLGGPALTASYLASGGDPIIGGIMGVASIVIAVPGLDPLCMLGFASYRYIPVYRTAFRATRMTLFMLPKFALTKLPQGVKDKVAWLFAKKDRRDFVRQALKSEALEVIEGPVINEKQNIFHLSLNVDKKPINMIFEHKKEFNGLALKELSLNGDIQSLKVEDIRKFSLEIKSIFGWNVSQAVKQTLVRVKKETVLGISSIKIMKNTYYIDDLVSSPQRTVVRFNDDAIRSSGISRYDKSRNKLSDKIFNSYKKTCNFLFRS